MVILTTVLDNCAGVVPGPFSEGKKNCTKNAVILEDRVQSGLSADNWSSSNNAPAWGGYARGKKP